MSAGEKISFQGEPGANSHIACLEAYPDMAPFPCVTFTDALMAVRDGLSRFAMIPIENSIAGRVADIHYLLPESGLFIVGEHFSRVQHCLLGLKGTSLSDLRHVQSHLQALSQCRKTLLSMGLTSSAVSDTAGAARMLAQGSDRSVAVIASALAAEMYGLDILRKGIEDENHNTTRFIVLARSRNDPVFEDHRLIMTSFIFCVRDTPAALYKAMGGFATNGVNMTKLESYQPGSSFTVTRFYADVEGHPDERRMRLAFEELSFFSSSFHILGVYPASPFRVLHM